MIRRLYQGDNLDILRNMKEGSVDAIITDPPFNVQYKLTSIRFDASFDDKWTFKVGSSIHSKEIELFLNFVKQTNKDKSLFGYLDMVATRLVEFQRILKPTGSLFWHCNEKTSHYVKLLLDIIFGVENYRNDIVWCYVSSGTRKKGFPKQFDTIFFYSKGEKNKFYRQKYEMNLSFPYEDEHGEYLYWSKTKNHKVYKNNCGYISNWWTDIARVNQMAKARVYPTQKPQKLYERIIKASTDEDDLILDPFCGSGTILVASENLKRQWIGIDQNSEAIEITEQRFVDLGHGQLLPKIEVIK